MKETDKTIVDSMFDKIAETRILPDGEVDVTLASDRAREMETAVSEFVESAREFFDCNAKLQCEIDPNRAGILWWRRLEWLALADSRLKDAFCHRTDRAKVSPCTTITGSNCSAENGMERMHSETRLVSVEL
jgi:hypothetical protein